MADLAVDLGPDLAAALVDPAVAEGQVFGQVAVHFRRKDRVKEACDSAVEEAAIVLGFVRFRRLDHALLDHRAEGAELDQTQPHADAGDGAQPLGDLERRVGKVAMHEFECGSGGLFHCLAGLCGRKELVVVEQPLGVDIADHILVGAQQIDNGVCLEAHVVIDEEQVCHMLLAQGMRSHGVARHGDLGAVDVDYIARDAERRQQECGAREADHGVAHDRAADAGHTDQDVDGGLAAHAGVSCPALGYAIRKAGVRAEYLP